MNTKKLQGRSVWRTVLLLIVVAVADVLLSAISIGLGLESGTVPDPEHAGIAWARFGLAPILAPLGAVALIWRHRFPTTVAATTAILGALSFSCIAFFVALFLLAKRRLSWWVAAIIALSIAAEALVGLEPLSWDSALVMAVLLAAIAGWGAYRGQRARLLESRLTSLRERAERAEVERVAAIETSKLAERHRIAREMHDTLAHRMSLVAVQAAALQVDAPDAETAKAARLIRETAHAALGELRDVLGVLHQDGTRTTQRSPTVETGLPRVEAPVAAMSRTAPSGIQEIAGLVAEWRQAGLSADYIPDPALCSGIPDALSRAAYRVVQEGMTNVARHAPEATATVTLELRNTECGGVNLRVSVVNGPGGRGEPALGAGLGLIGLGERVQLLNGSLIHRSTGSGFELIALIPFEQQSKQESNGVAL
ncbi:sensor histidine kinase [Arthrobacter sp. TMN-49]